jgi:hypothetical protein
VQAEGIVLGTPPLSTTEAFSITFFVWFADGQTGLL